MVLQGCRRLSNLSKRTESKKPADFNWRTWGDVDISAPGKVRISVQGETVTLNYDGKRLEPLIETIIQDDPALSRVWGDRIYRVTLRERKAAVRGVSELQGHGLFGLDLRSFKDAVIFRIISEFRDRC